MRSSGTSISDVGAARLSGLFAAALPIFYNFQISPQIFHVLFITFIALIYFSAPWARVTRAAVGFSAVVAFLVFASLIVELGAQPVVRSYVTVIAVGIEMFLLLAIITPRSYAKFFQVYALVTSVLSVVNLFMMLTGMVGNHFGRFLFFGNAHPNLGGEIYVAAIFLGALSFPRARFILIALPLLVAIVMIQARAALASGIAIFLVKFFLESGFKVSSKSFLRGFAAMLLILGVLFLQSDVQDFVFSKLFLVNDEYRGLGSNFVGRDVRWLIGINSFLESPLLGAGLSLYDAEGSFSPHNAIIYGLSMSGLFSLTLWWFLGVFLYRAAKIDLRVGIYAACLLPVFLLNDRYLNLNPYPFLIYFAILHLGSFKVTHRPHPQQTINT